MKKKIFAGIALVIAIIIVRAGFWYWQNLRGSGPAFSKPPQDITQLIPSSPTSTPPTVKAKDSNTTTVPLKLPDGFSINIFAKDLVNPRVLVFDPAGNILTSITSKGQIVALKDTNGDGVSDQTVVVASGLNKPHGLAFRCTDACKLYVAETDKVSTYDYDAKKTAATNKKKILDLPGGGRHFTRTIMFLPAPNDEKFLIAVGSSCDTCHESNSERGTIMVANADGSGLKVYASGLRNSVFMTLHPVTGDVWATEMGRDGLGDNIPPDEINIIKPGAFYGWPICYGQNIHDTKFDTNTYVRNPCQSPTETPATIDIPAHSAPLGIAFAPEEGWPQEYWYNAFVAYHGSWNRSVPTGYKVVRYKLDAQGKLIGTEDFLSGFLTSKGALGRPAGILTKPGGAMYISDDKAGVIYRVYRTNEIQQ